MDDITPLRQLAAAMPDTLFTPAPAYRVPRSLYTDTPVPPDEPLAENPPTGAVIDYYLAQPAQGPVTLEISDARGAPIRRFASTDPPELTPAQLAAQLIPAYWVRPHRALGTTAGGHRWIWDLRGERPVALSYDYPISAVPHDAPRTPEGPLVLPGRYTVKLTVDGKTLTAPLDVKLDPRIKLPAAAIAQQHQLSTRLATLVTRGTQLVRQAQSTADQLTRLAGKSEPLQAQIAAAADKVTAVLQGPKGPPPAPGRDHPPGPHRRRRQARLALPHARGRRRADQGRPRADAARRRAPTGDERRRAPHASARAPGHDDGVAPRAAASHRVPVTRCRGCIDLPNDVAALRRVSSDR